MIFRTFRQRLLFWFLVFISSNFILIGLVLFYFQQRSQIEKTSELVNTSHLFFLKYVKSQQDFLAFDTHSEEFFMNNLSDNLNACDTFYDSTIVYNELAIESTRGRFGIRDDLGKFRRDTEVLDSMFNHLVGLIFIRGYKNLNVIGEIRDDAHWLENTKEIPAVDILSLRRHEKDYLLRNEGIYVQRFSFLLEELANKIGRNKSINSQRKDSLINRIYSYQRHFFELVDLDNLIGLNNNIGLKRKIDLKILTMESQITSIVDKARIKREELFYKLNLTFGVIMAALIIISVIVSYFISSNITGPLHTLSIYISNFVASNFKLQEEHPKSESRDEIGDLIKNFGLMKNEVVNSIDLLSFKVAERTEELAHANEKLTRINSANKRFVPQKFLQLLGRQGIEEVQLGDQANKTMTVMFTDIRSFTQISESLSPQENFDFINSYLQKIVPIIQENEGFIDKYIGDSIMALFPQNPETAIQATLKFEKAIQEFNKELQSKNMNPIKIGSGIHTGDLILGTVGTEKRLDTTVISDAVNISSRIEGLTKQYGLSTIFTDQTLLYLENKSDYNFRYLDYVKVKGKTYPISIYDLIKPEDNLKISLIPDWNKAIDFYFIKDFNAAFQAFEKIYDKNPEDQTAKIYMNRCLELMNNPPDENWNGVQIITIK